MSVLTQAQFDAFRRLAYTVNSQSRSFADTAKEKSVMTEHEDSNDIASPGTEYEICDDPECECCHPENVVYREPHTWLRWEEFTTDGRWVRQGIGSDDLRSYGMEMMTLKVIASRRPDVIRNVRVETTENTDNDED